MNIPADLSPEIATWLRLQMMIAATRAIEPMREEIQELEGFVDSLLVATSQFVHAALEINPTLAKQLAPHWQHAHERYEALSNGAPKRADDEDRQMLEARSAIYRACERTGVWGRRPGAAGGSARPAK